MWMKCCRLVLNLPCRTHGRLIPYLVGTADILTIIENRMIIFFTKRKNIKIMLYLFYLTMHFLIVITHILQVILIKLLKNIIYSNDLDLFIKKYFKLKK